MKKGKETKTEKEKLKKGENEQRESASMIGKGISQEGKRNAGRKPGRNPETAVFANLNSGHVVLHKFDGK